MEDDKNLVEREKLEDEENIDVSPFLYYLESEQGHELASRVLAIFEDIKKATIQTSTSHAKFEKWLQAMIVLVVVGAASILTYLGKFDSTLGVLFGTLLGYLLVKNKSLYKRESSFLCHPLGSSISRLDSKAAVP